tara:strand:- start:200 stop:781 length:582 start_codon:yes stop_codon:yes gene_type:complete
MKIKLLFLLPLFAIASCASPEAENAEIDESGESGESVAENATDEEVSETCHLIDHPDIDLTLKSMDDYAEMNWEAHRASYTEDGTVHLNTLDPEKLVKIDDSIENYKVQRKNGVWSEFFWTGRNADRVILDYPGLDPEAWVFVWANWNGVLAESGDTITSAVHIANRMSSEGLIRYHYVNIDRAPIVTALSKK